ncbi:hypothetical protein SDC9_106208 [bioreactor metagenome]|uniref:Uncharacterized protein n=1 Tax=bioreactor metagenome TaxID=1076179 RepID=A0A645B2R2_9ZZZZ
MCYHYSAYLLLINCYISSRLMIFNKMHRIIAQKRPNSPYIFDYYRLYTNILLYTYKNANKYTLIVPLDQCIRTMASNFCQHVQTGMHKPKWSLSKRRICFHILSRILIILIFHVKPQNTDTKTVYFLHFSSNIIIINHVVAGRKCPDSAVGRIGALY